MRKVLILLLLITVFIGIAGCAGSASPNATTARFAGTWSGTWVNTTDSTDAGTSTWTIAANGSVDGHDYDPGRQTTFHVVGSIDELGNLTSNSTPVGGSPSTLNGPFTFSANGTFSGVLVWGVTPPLDYLYTFTKQ